MTYWNNHSFYPINADQPIHSGLTQKWLHDNFNCVHEKCTRDYTLSLPVHSTSYYYSEVGPNPAVWVEMAPNPPYGYLPIPVYKGLDGDYRPIDISLEAYRTAGTATFYVYLLASPMSSGADGIPFDNITSYASFTSSDTTPTYHDVTITPQHTSRQRMSSLTGVDVVYLQVAVTLSLTGTVWLRNIRIADQET